MTLPSWFRALSWSVPVAIETVRADRELLPRSAGVYVFTNYPSALEPNTGVLYVGKADTSLHTRVQSYLADPAQMKVLSARSGTLRLNSSLKHAGKAQLLVEVQQKSRGDGPSGIWLRWTLTPAPRALEARLIALLQPAFNSQS